MKPIIPSDRNEGPRKPLGQKIEIFYLPNLVPLKRQRSASWRKS